MHRLGRSLTTPPMLVALLALAIATAGTSYAALRLPPNSVGTSQLERNAVTSSKVKDGTLVSADFRRGTLLRGPAGPQGPAGTVETFGFYSKAEADARFLPTGGTAANALHAANADQLGGSPASAFLQGDGTDSAGVWTIDGGTLAMNPAAPGVVNVSYVMLQN